MYGSVSKEDVSAIFDEHLLGGIPVERLTVHLASLDTVDPPFAEAEALGGRFVAITEARGCSPVELELLRRAYTVILG